MTHTKRTNELWTKSGEGGWDSREDHLILNNHKFCLMHLIPHLLAFLTNTTHRMIWNANESVIKRMTVVKISIYGWAGQTNDFMAYLNRNVNCVNIVENMSESDSGYLNIYPIRSENWAPVAAACNKNRKKKTKPRKSLYWRMVTSSLLALHRHVCPTSSWIFIYAVNHTIQVIF